MDVITPGGNCGPATGTFRTDVITVITVNPVSQLSQYNLTGITPATFTSTTTSAAITVNAATNIASGPSQVLPGQLIMLSNVNGSCLLTVSAVNTSTNTITFNKGDATNDPFGFNQFSYSPGGPTSGTLGQLVTAGPPPTYPPTTAFAITLISYYLDNTVTPERLMRLVGTGAPMAGTPPVPTQPAQPVALGIYIMQFTYDLWDGTTVTANQMSASLPEQIRKVNMSLTGRADHPNRKTGVYFSNTFNTSVAVQNLSYYNKYQ